MVELAISVEVAPGHEVEWEDEWRALALSLPQFPGFRTATLLRDSEASSHYVVLHEWDGHDLLAQAMRRLLWLGRDTTLPWTAGPIHVFDEVVEVVGHGAGSGERNVERSTPPSQG